MNIPDNLKYTESHEWVRREADGTVTVGITEFAQSSLGDIVLVQLPTVAKSYDAGGAVAVVESAKAASDIFSPLSGEVIAVNEAVIASPDLINADAYANWLFKMKPVDVSSFDGLLDAAAYEKTVGS